MGSFYVCFLFPGSDILMMAGSPNPWKLRIRVLPWNILPGLST